MAAHSSTQREATDLTSMLAAISNAPSSERLKIICQYTRAVGGLRSDAIRRQAWPILLGCADTGVTAAKADAHPLQAPSAEPIQANWRTLPAHKDEEQVQKDVDRSFVYYPHDQSPSQLDRLRIELSEVITATLRSHPRLSYFQGFHDIAQVLLLVLGRELAPDSVARLSMLRLRDFMLPSLASSLTQLNLLPAILDAADPELAAHVAHAPPSFALGAMLTLFAHEVESYSDIARVFDFLLAEQAAAALYLCTSILVARRHELLEIPKDDTDMLFFTMQKMPKSLDLEALIQRCRTLLTAHPPACLPQGAWRRIPTHSVLKTTASGHIHTLTEAEGFLDAQLMHWKWQERRGKVLALLWVYRRPIGGLGAAAAVVLVSYWIQRRL